jgi:hydrogenase maturation factor
MHDPTEGGLATALHEIAGAAGVGMEIYSDQIPIFDETRIICQALDLDPLGLIASGSLLMCVDAGDGVSLLTDYREAGMTAARIGVVTKPEAGVLYEDERGMRIPLKTFARDEICRISEAP